MKIEINIKCEGDEIALLQFIQKCKDELRKFPDPPLAEKEPELQFEETTRKD